MCYYPFYVNDKPVPCGYCPACCLRRSNSWAFRCYQETLRSDSILWIRLSYDNYHLPISSNGRASLDKKAIQKFIKRYRYYHKGPYRKLKYFLCGEYGSQFQRPHYHILFFNADPLYLVDAWRDADGQLIGEIYIDPRPFDLQCVIYTCGYMLKPCTAGYGKDTRERKFLLMSKKIGDNYLTPKQVSYHWLSAERNFVTLPGGIRLPLPRYYADKIFKPKAVNGFICPVARLACDLFKEAREELLDATTRKDAARIYREHKDTYGSADDFIRSQNEARLASIINFQKKASGRLDV